MGPSCNMNPRKKFKPRNSNSNSENELPSVLQGHLSQDRHSSKSNNGKNSPTKQRQNNCIRNSPNKSYNSPPRSSPQKHPTATNCTAVKRQLNYNHNLVLSEPKQLSPSDKSSRPRRSPRKNSPLRQDDIASPKLSFSSPNAADVPLPPTHWFSGCSRELLNGPNISAQLKTLLNVV